MAGVGYRAIVCALAVVLWQTCFAVVIKKSGTYTCTLNPNTTSTSEAATDSGSFDIVVPAGSSVTVKASKDVVGGSNYDGHTRAVIDNDGSKVSYDSNHSVRFSVSVRSRNGWNATYEVEFKIDVAYTSSITFEFEGGSGGTKSTVVSERYSMPSISLPTRAGYEFLGYFTERNGKGTQYYLASGESACAWDRTDSISLYAAWRTSVTYDVRYNPGDFAFGEVETVKKGRGASIWLKGATFVRDGYTMEGWSKRPDGATLDFALGASYSADAAIDLYPYWVKSNRYYFAFALPEDATLASGTPGSAIYGVSVCLPAPQRRGYAFSGWTVTSGLDASTAKWGTAANPQSPVEDASTLCQNGAHGDIYFLNLTRVDNAIVTLKANWIKTVPGDWYVSATAGRDGNGGRSSVDAFATIQKAIDAAVEGQTVVVDAGTYGPIETNDKFLRIVSAQGPEKTVIDAWGKGVPCANLGGSENGRRTVMEGFTLRNGGVGSTDGLEFGGGAVGGTLINCTIEQCRAKAGGGARYSTLLNCTISNNLAEKGGALGDCTAVDCNIEYNRAENYGGGVFACVLTNCHVYGNRVEKDYARWTSCSGGGAYQSTLVGCVVKNNSVSMRKTISDLGLRLIPPQTVYCECYGGGASRCTMRNCLLRDNVAGYGGGTHDGTLIGCTLSKNVAHDENDGMYVIAGGAFGGGDGVVMRNCIVWGNTKVMSGSNTSVQSDLGGTMDCAYVCTATSVPGVGNVISDPKFVDPANGNYRLRADSPCVNAGDGSCVETGETDIDGGQRVCGGKVDIGAYEYCVTYPVKYASGIFGTGDDSEDIKRQGQPLTLEGAIFVRIGYMQTGWSKDPGGTTCDYGLEASYVVDAAVTLYPYWVSDVADSLIMLERPPDPSHDQPSIPGDLDDPQPERSSSPADPQPPQPTSVAPRQVEPPAPADPMAVDVPVVEPAGAFEAPKATTDGGVLVKDGKAFGVLQVKVGKASKTGESKVSVTVIGLDGKKYTAKAVKVPTGDTVTKDFEVKKLGTLTLTFGANGFSGTLNGATVTSVDANFATTDGKATFSPGDLSSLSGVLTKYLPQGETVERTEKKWKVAAKAGKLKYVKPNEKKGVAGGLQATGDNIAALKLTYAPKTQTFKGSFKVWTFDEAKKKLKSVSAKVTGVVVNGAGYGQAVVKKAKLGELVVK